MTGRLSMWLLLVTAALSHAAQAEERDWRLVTDRDGVLVYMSHNDDSSIKTFRGEAVVPMSDLRAIGNQVEDYEFVASWMHMISSISELSRESGVERKIWVTTRLPWPVSNRDAALDLHITQEPDTGAVVIAYEANDNLLEPQAGYVRMPALKGMLRFTPVKPGEVHLTFEVVLDPGGYIPAWIANLILRDIPYFSLRRYQRVSDQQRFQGNDRGYYRIPAGWPGATE
ncbi:MAG: START domain-containing protein [Alcanivoracaceae bacterium]|nr:START domain-containing protein [Alcanivoracaceae bacterium]